MITVFTPTYNRAYTLPRLYQSLQQQDCTDFEWLVINDGSNDNTDALFTQWEKEKNPFPIRYLHTPNGGKQRAINKALSLAHGEYFFIVDSDDLLCPDAISFIRKSFQELPDDDRFIGISSIRGDLAGNPLNGAPRMDTRIGYIDANNLERKDYNLQADMAEVFYTAKLRPYSFPVWEGENFTPEAVIWDRLAMDGYQLRWFDKVIYLCDYQPDGLTHSSWRLLKNNPMGYALLFNTQLEYAKGWKPILSLILQFEACCMLGREYGYISKCQYPLIAFALLPVGWLLYRRRKRQCQQWG